MNSQPMRNSYLRSELINFLRTLSAMAAMFGNTEYRQGWLAALAALAMLVGVAPNSIEGTVYDD